MVSVVYDYGKTVPATSWTPDSWSQFQEIIKRLNDLDKKLGEPECHDPAKAEWVKEVEERLAKLEGKDSVTD